MGTASGMEFIIQIELIIQIVKEIILQVAKRNSLTGPVAVTKVVWLAIESMMLRQACRAISRQHDTNWS